MAAIPKPAHTTANQIFKMYEEYAESGHRPHLGASLIGHPCERFLWLTFRHAASKKFPGRMLRLFETGKLEERRIIANLRAIGCEVHADDGSGQYRVSALGGHFGGSMDAVITNYHEAPKKWLVCEMKTHNAKSFKELCEKTVAVAKPQHYTQMQIYMGLSQLDRALYFAVNKDTDDIYTEYVRFDQVEFNRLMARAQRIIEAPEPPLRLSQDPSWYQCKFCDMNALCHGTAAPEVNCRTCAHSTPDTTSGEWVCLRHDGPVMPCVEHRYIPILLENFAEPIDANEEQNWVKYRNKLTGAEFYNGDLSSQEIHACEDKRALGNASVNALRDAFDAKVVA